MNEFYKAVLAIRDGELEAFKTLLPNLQDRADELFIKTAERPGIVGRKMTMLMLDKQPTFSQGIYRAACLLAIDIADSEKTLFLLEQAQSHVTDLPVQFYGDIAECAYMDHPHIAAQIIDCCTPEQMDAVPADLLYKAMVQNDYRFAYKLAEKGICADDSIQEIAGYCARNAQNWDIESLLQRGMQISAENYAAMRILVEHGWTESGQILLDRGMDFDAFTQWAAENHIDLSGHDSFEQLDAHWAGIQEQDRGIQMS